MANEIAANETLTPLDVKLMCLFAYQTVDIDAQELRAYAKNEGLTLERVRELMIDAINQGVLESGSYDWYDNGRAYHIHPDHYLEYILLLIRNKKSGWVEDYAKALKRVNSQGSYLYKTLQLVLNNVKVDASTQWVFYGLDRLLWPLYRYPELYNIVLKLNEMSMEGLIVKAVQHQMEDDNPDLGNALGDVLDLWEKRNGYELYDLRALIAFNRYLATGVVDSNRSTRITTFGMLMEGVQLALQGDYARALTNFEMVLKITRTSRIAKNTFSNIFTAYFHVLTCVHEGSAESMKKVAYYAPTRNDNVMADIFPARLLAVYFGSNERKMDLLDLAILTDESVAAQHFAYLLAQYTHMGTDGAFAHPFSIPRYAILRHELRDFLPLDEAERQHLKEAFGDEPLLTSIRFKEAWECALEDILKKGEETLTTELPDEERQVRMMYLLYRGRVEVREQKRLRNGKWGAGKAVSAYLYNIGDLDYMDQRDRNVWNALKHSENYELVPELLLPEMVGTDRVYTGTSAPYTPVTITESKPYLTIEKDKEWFTVRASYEPKGNRKMFSSPTHVVTQISSTEYMVTPIEGRQRHIFDQLLQVRRFPLKAEEALKAFFPKVSQMIEVHSASFAEGNTLPTVDGSAVIYLQVSPVKEAFHVRFVVRPLPGGQLTFTPGKGPILVPDEAEGNRVQVHRLLKEERHRMQTLTTYIDELTDLDEGDGVRDDEVELNGEALLSLIDYIRPLGEQYVMEWQEGKPLCVKQAAEPKKWKIGLKSHGGWFDVEGDVQLDDHTILSMAQLLQMIGHQRGEYIRLNDTDYLHLTDALRRQLSRLESVAVRQKDKMRIPTLTAGLLSDEALNDAFTVKTDRTLTDLRQRIVESSTLRPKVPAKLKATLRDYQLDGFQWIARLNHWGAGACLADDMGLGKTVQTIAYLIYMQKEGPSLVVAPTSVVPNWQKELARFAPSLKAQVLNECPDRSLTIQEAGPGDVIVSTYGLLMSESEALLAKGWNVVCLDEAHTIKNRETKTSASAMQLQAAHRLILTGTPVQNHLGELWNLFQFINPGLLGSYEQFQEKFIVPIEGNHDKQRQLQLNRLVHPFMLRRTKHEVVEELPDKEEIIYPVEMSDAEMSVYELIRREAQQMVENGGAKVNVATLAQITKLRQAACCAQLVEPKWQGGCSKIDRLVDLLTELREGGNRALVFSQFTSFFALIRQALDAAGIPYLYLDGSTPVRQRQHLVEEFQEGDCPFFLISLKAGGLGLNLTGANYIIHLDPWWNPAIEQQATDRAYRIGQTQKVTAYHLVAAHTIEEKILRLHTTKRNLSDALLSGTDVSHKLTAKDLLEILQED
jgi:superfamily II DNA or RNA helicase